LGRLDEAEAMAGEAVERFRENPAALTEHAWIAVARRDWKEALRRWMQVYRPDPNRLDATVGVIQALRMVGRLDEAEAMATEATRRFPDSADLAVEHVWGAVARDDWQAVAARLESARRALNDAARFDESLGWVENELRRGAARAGSPAAAPSRLDNSHLTDTAAAAAESVSTKDLMLSFESLGERCDFGAVQRRYGVEPLGLLRFAYAAFDPLIAALEDRLEAIGTVEDTGFERYNDENILYMKKYGLIFHTFVSQKELNTRKKRDNFRDQQRRRLAFLRDKLASDLEDPQKIFVYSTDERTSDADAKHLFTALRAYGPNSLLYVRPARQGCPAGTVEVLENGLFAGYYSGLVDFLTGQQPPFELWRRICERTYRLAQTSSS
jgi:tetratricopeptide (TPR) repeat protein